MTEDEFLERAEECLDQILGSGEPGEEDTQDMAQGLLDYLKRHGLELGK